MGGSSYDSPTHSQLQIPMSANTELAATYAALILADAESEITSEKILALTTAAGIDIEPIWATLLSKALEGKNVKEMLSTISVGTGSATPIGGAAAPIKDVVEEPVDSAPADTSDDDSDDGGMFGGGLFD
ncbi:60S acidic ribosomal protein P1 [Mycena alexandri]|uniref:60S acidic ribosomal protein P1 n=1 Tax=Mycena alexandri TaxID=1745969 RepID=A0AAD6X2F4_9AGAR|nr:60S acidic ribosomal protein P1 [Mycena alexandri]